MAQDDPLAGLPDPDEPVFYPKVGHCIYRGVIEDKVAPDTKLLELEDLEEGSRILVPVGRVPALNLRPAGVAFDAIKEVLSADFELPIEDDAEREALIEQLITDGSPTSLAKALKHLHLLRQTTGLSREEELTRKKIRSWLAAEVSLARESTRAEAQAFMTRILQEAMASHHRKEKEEAKERRRVAKEQKKADEAHERALALEAAEDSVTGNSAQEAPSAEASSSPAPSQPAAPPDTDSSEIKSDAEPSVPSEGASHENGAHEPEPKLETSASESSPAKKESYPPERPGELSSE